MRVSSFLKSCTWPPRLPHAGLSPGRGSWIQGVAVWRRPGRGGGSPERGAGSMWLLGREDDVEPDPQPSFPPPSKPFYGLICVEGPWPGCRRWGSIKTGLLGTQEGGEGCRGDYGRQGRKEVRESISSKSQSQLSTDEDGVWSFSRRNCITERSRCIPYRYTIVFIDYTLVGQEK